MPNSERHERHTRRAEVVKESRTPALTARDGRAAEQTKLSQRLTRHSRNGHSLDLDAPVQTAHPRDVDSSAQLGKCRNGARIGNRESPRYECGGLVRRKEFLVVFEDSEIVPRDEPIRGVSL